MTDSVAVPTQRVPLHPWLDAVSLALSLFAIAAWVAQVIFILTHGGNGDSGTVRMIVLCDALPPGIVGGGMLVVAAVARRRQRPWGARLLGFGGIVALLLSATFTSALGNLFVYNGEGTMVGRAFGELDRAMTLLLIAKLVSAVVIGGIRWRADKHSRRVQPFLPSVVAMPATNPDSVPAGSQPVGRLPDLLSFLTVLFTWFCVVPVTGWPVVPLIIPGPSMFVAGFPVGLVGVVALLAAGLLRAGRDRKHLVPLELFAVLALTMLFVSAAVRVAAGFSLPTVAMATPSSFDWITPLAILSWVLFGLAMLAKLVLIVAAMIRRRERMQFSLLGMLAFMIGCGALVMYWRIWQQ